jgi:hypothetical protein
VARMRGCAALSSCGCPGNVAVMPISGGHTTESEQQVVRCRGAYAGTTGWLDLGSACGRQRRGIAACQHAARAEHRGGTAARHVRRRQLCSGWHAMGNRTGCCGDKNPSGE